MNAKEREKSLALLHERFDSNPGRHEGLAWADIQARLEAYPRKVQPAAAASATTGLA